MRRASKDFLCVLCVLCGAMFSAHAEDTITLNDGKTVKGEISKEDADTVYLKLPDGESRAIAKTRISKIERVQIKRVVGGGGLEPRIPAAPENKETLTQPGALEVTLLYTELKNIGSSDPLKRAAALEFARQKKAEATPVLLGMLNPKLAGDEWTHIAILRALSELAPLTDQAAQTLAWSAVFDPFPEARREACNTIRRIQDDRAIRQLINYGISENAKQKHAGAVALHEIDDNRVLAALIRAVPTPSVSANLGEATGLTAPAFNLPVGPAGARMPIYLPRGEVSGTATDLTSPATELLKLIAGKDFGILPYSWGNWYREKTGEIAGDDRDAYRDKRSIRDRMNAP